MHRGKSEDEAPIETSPARRTEDGLHQDRVLWLLGLSGDPRRVALNARCTRFGRGADCQVVLAGGEASRHHAEISRVGPVYVIRDLGTRNGTSDDGKRVAEAPLVPGAVVRMGEWLACAREAAGPEPAAADFSAQGPALWGSQILRAAVAPAHSAAASKLPIILEGETGTGKEVVARAIHSWSGRGGPFVAVNCAALPEALAEGELFGYRRGAFTGAERANAGFFRAAHGGTLLLDEICDLPLPLQVKLLRVLEQQEVVPLGEATPVPVDVRVLAAAQEPLGNAVAQRRFRADLYARLDGLTVRLPPLRERIEDVVALLELFVAEHRPGLKLQLTANALETMLLYDWPFNVRELRLLGQRLSLLLAQQASIHRRELPERMRPRLPSAPDSSASPQDVAAGALASLLAALRAHRGNVTRAAQAAGISRMRAYRLMNAHPKIDVATFREGEKGSA